MHSELNHISTFIRLKSLVGTWHGINEDKEPTTVNYALTAADSALVESWIFDNGSEALTIYHMDNDILMAMHYCPIGNQPRLDLKEQLADGTLKFECVSATHMKSFKDPHEHAFDLKLIENGSFYRTETYVEKDGSYQSNGILFQRAE